MKNPTYAPVTTDIRLDHSSGVQVFVDLKNNSAKVEDLSTGQQRLSHPQVDSWYNRPVFTFRAAWDYILTMIDDNKGYLLIRDDLPTTFWHQLPDGQGYIHHDFANKTFLLERLVLFDRPDSEVVTDICRILKGTGKSWEDGPLKATLSAEEIYPGAGPCPPELLKYGQIGGPASFANILDFTHDLESSDKGSEGQDDNGEQDKGKEAEDLEQAILSTSTNHLGKRGSRVKELHRTAQLITLLMKQCRAK